MPSAVPANVRFVLATASATLLLFFVLLRLVVVHVNHVEPPFVFPCRGGGSVPTGGTLPEMLGVYAGLVAATLTVEGRPSGSPPCASTREPCGRASAVRRVQGARSSPCSGPSPTVCSDCLYSAVSDRHPLSAPEAKPMSMERSSLWRLGSVYACPFHSDRIYRAVRSTHWRRAVGRSPRHCIPCVRMRRWMRSMGAFPS